MKNKKTLWYLLAAAVLLIGAWFAFRPKTNQNLKSITIEVNDKDGNKEVFGKKTEAEYLRQAMDEFADAGFTYQGEDGEYGYFVTEINGKKADPADSAYWAIYVNGEYGQYGIDQQPVTDGDIYSFTYETY
jgi:hypothetical protein